VTDPDAVARRAHVGDAVAIATLHRNGLPDSFLASLGMGFLTRLYRRVVRFEGSFVLVTGPADSPDGFVAVAEHTGSLYRSFLVRDGLAAGVRAMPTVLRAPVRTWETFRYGARPPGPAAQAEPVAEILAVAVAASSRGRGLGTALITSALAEVQARGVRRVHVVTAADNVPAIAMYESAGFGPHATVEVHAGVEQVVLTWG